MKPVAFDYVRPDGVDDALKIARQNGDAKFIAGGQSLLAQCLIFVWRGHRSWSTYPAYRNSRQVCGNKQRGSS